MKEKFIKKLASIGLFAVLGLAACTGGTATGGNTGGDDTSDTGDTGGETGGDTTAKTNVTVTAVEHASALVTFGSFSMETFQWTYSFDPAESVSDYTLAEGDESLVIVLDVDDGYDITAVSVNDNEIMSYMKGDAKAIYPVTENGDYVVTLTVEEKPAYDSTVTHVACDFAEISYIVIDADWNEYSDVEYYDESDWNEVGHVSFPYSEPTVVDVFVTIFDPNYEVDQVLVNGMAADPFEHPMTGQTYYEYELPGSGDYVVTVTFNTVAA